MKIIMWPVLLVVAGACGEKRDLALADCRSVNVPVPTRYEAHVAPIFAAHCTGCHAADVAKRKGAPDGLNFDTYAAASASIDDALASMASGSMPPRGPSVSGEDFCIVSAWAETGRSR